MTKPPLKDTMCLCQVSLCYSTIQDTENVVPFERSIPLHPNTYISRRVGTVSQGTGLFLNNKYRQSNNMLLTKITHPSVLYFGTTRTISEAPQIRICHSFLILSNLKVLGGLNKNTVNFLNKMGRYRTQRNISLKISIKKKPNMAASRKV